MYKVPDDVIHKDKGKEKGKIKTSNNEMEELKSSEIF